MPRLRQPVTLAELAARYGGEVRAPRLSGDLAARVDDDVEVDEIVPVHEARRGQLAPVLRLTFVESARVAAQRGALLLVDAAVAARAPDGVPVWVHPQANWAMACVLDGCEVEDTEPSIGPGALVSDHVVIGPRVVIGRNVRIGAGAVIGHPGFGWANGPRGELRAVPQLGGVVIEDDVSIGPLTTIDAGTLSPTIIRRGAKLDAHVHVGHNSVVGEECILAAQSGLAGSVVLGRGVQLGGQVGIADHVTVGDGARIAAKSGVIGDVPPGAVVAGYPAQPRMRWLRSLAWLHRASTDADA